MPFRVRLAAKSRWAIDPSCEGWSRVRHVSLDLRKSFEQLPRLGSTLPTIAVIAEADCGFY